MVRKSIACFLSLILLLSVAGCAVSTSGGPTVDPGEEGPPAVESTTGPLLGDRKVISMWFWGYNEVQGAALQKNIIDVYNASQDEFEFIVENKGASVDNDIPVALSADAGPDIIYSSGPAFCNVYVQEGKLLNLDTYAEQYGWKDRLLPALYDACIVKGSLYSLPNAISVGGIVYNKALLEEKGWPVPTTMAQLEEVMDMAIADGLYGSAAGNRGWRACNDNFSSILINHFVSPSNMYDCLTGAQPFNNPDMLAAIEKSYDWYKKAYLSGDDYPAIESADAMQLVADRRAPFFFSPSLLIQLAASCFEGIEDEFGYIPMPNLYAEGTTVYDVAMPCALSINASTEYPDECAKILDLMMTPEFAQGMTETWPGYWSVALRDMSAIDSSNMDGISKAFMDALADASAEIDAGHFGFHPSTFFPPVTQERWRDIDSVWQGVMTAEEFLIEVDKAFAEELADGMVAPLAKPTI